MNNQNKNYKNNKKKKNRKRQDMVGKMEKKT